MAARGGIGLARWLGLAAAASVGLWPLLPHAGAWWSPLRAAYRALEPWFALHCQLDPSRGVSVAGLPLAVCARCSGIYFGFGLGALIRRPQLSPRALRYATGAAALLMLGDVQLERYGWHPPWATLRLVTGLLLAYPVGAGLGALLARAPKRAHSP